MMKMPPIHRSAPKAVTAANFVTGIESSPAAKISRQAGSWYEPARKQCERSVIIESDLTALNCCRVGKSRNPAAF